MITLFVIQCLDVLSNSRFNNYHPKTKQISSAFFSQGLGSQGSQLLCFAHSSGQVLTSKSVFLRLFLVVRLAAELLDVLLGQILIYISEYNIAL